jgi:hypothetical protein
MELELLRKMSKSGASVRNFRSLPYLWEYNSAVEQVRKEDLVKLLSASYVTDIEKAGNRSVITRKGTAALRSIDHAVRAEEKKIKNEEKAAAKIASKVVKKAKKDASKIASKVKILKKKVKQPVLKIVKKKKKK